MRTRWSFPREPNGVSTPFLHCRGMSYVGIVFVCDRPLNAMSRARRLVHCTERATYEACTSRERVDE